MAVPSYGLIVDPKYIYFSESAQRALQHIKNCASDLWERPHHRYVARFKYATQRVLCRYALYKTLDPA